MATTEKLSVTLDHDDAAWARQRAHNRKTSFSAVLSETVRQAREFEAREKYLQWALAEQPPLTAEELAAAERELAGVHPELGGHAIAKKSIRKTPRKAATKRRANR